MRKVIENFGLVILVVGMAYAVIRVGELPFPSFDEESLSSYVPGPVKELYDSTTGGSGAPPRGGQMIDDAVRDLARRFRDGEYVPQIADELRACMKDRTMSHKAADLYPARVCFVELSTIRLGLQKGAGLPNILPMIVPHYYFREIVLFSNADEVEWADGYAPFHVMELFQQEQAAFSQ